MSEFSENSFIHLDDYYFKKQYGISQYERLAEEDAARQNNYARVDDFVRADDFYDSVRYGEAYGGLEKAVQVNTIQVGEWVPVTHADKMVYHSSDFASSTSAHGIGWIAKEDNGFLRFIWILVYLTCVGNFLFQIINVVQKFQRNEKIVDIQLKFEAVHFPAVTVCNLNPYKFSTSQNVGDISRMLKAMDDAMDAAGGKEMTDEEKEEAAAQNHHKRRKRQDKEIVYRNGTSHHSAAEKLMEILGHKRQKREDEGHQKVVFEMSYSDCTCESGDEEECHEMKMQEPDDESDCCFCAFDRHSGDAWPCYKNHLWKEDQCDTCNEEGFCPKDGPKGITVHCYCNPIMCVAYDGTEILKLWEYYGAGAPTEDPGFLEALGFGGMTDEVAILTKARENMMFAMAGVSNADRIAMSYSQRDLIHKCSFNGQQCDMITDFTPHLDPVFGQCFTYNHNRSVKLASGRAGPMYGLRMMVYVNLTEYLPTTEAAGVRLTVHNKDEFPFPDTFGYSAPVGYISSFGIRLKSVDRLPHPYGDCVPGGNMRGFIYQGYAYSTENLILDTCDCGDPRFPVLEGSSHCSMSNPKSRKCLDMRMKELGGMHGKFKCDCAQPCKQSMYDVTYSAAVWPAVALKVSSCPKTPTECAVEYRENGAMIEVFYEQLNFEMLEESQAYGWVNLLSDFGGQLGLWLGVSMITCFEFCMFLWKLTFVSGHHHYASWRQKKIAMERAKNSG